MSGQTASPLAELYRECCTMDVAAFKPGNVSQAAPGHGMCADDFIRSASCSAPAMVQTGIPLGRRVLDAVTLTHQVVGCNTNLGIVLLCAPLLHAQLNYPELSLREGVQRVLAATTVADADAVYRAIRLASPAGLGERADHDVAEPARLTLTDAMREASGYDRVARQYANGYADLFDEVQSWLAAALQRKASTSSAVSELFLWLLAAYPDSHIQRKHGVEVARRVSDIAATAKHDFLTAADEVAATRCLSDLDSVLKRDGLNPGTSADFCVAGLLIHRLHGQAASRIGETRQQSRTLRPDRAKAPQTATSQQYQGELKWQ